MSDIKFLQKNWTCLVENLTSSVNHHILDEMLSKLKLKKDEYDSIYACGGTDCDKARKLMQLVSSRGEPALKVFKDTLQDCNPELYECLQQTEEADHGSSSVTLEKAVFSSDHDSDDSASSGIESLSPTRSFTPNDDEEVDRSAEPVRMTKREIDEMMEDLDKKGTEQRLQSNMKEATSTYSKLAQLTGLCAKQEEGELGFEITHFNLKGAKEMLQQSYTDGTLKENVQEPLANLAKGKPHNFLNMEVDVDLQWSEEQGKSRQKEDAKGQEGTIKVTGKNVKLADGHVLDEGAEGAFECLCNHLVENKDELIPIIRYLNSIDIQVCGITRGCIELKFRCFNQDAAVHLQEKETIQRLKASFQSVVSACMKQFGLESLELDIKCQFCQDKTEEAPPELIATSQPAVYPLTGAQTTTYTAISRPTSATLQTDTVNTGTPENKVQEEHPPSKSNTVNMTNKAANTSGLDRVTSVDNLVAPPSPIKPVEHSNLRGLFLAMVGGKDLSCADAADDGSRLHVTFRQVQTALQTRSKKAQQQQKDVLKAARDGTDDIIHHLRKEITRLTKKEEKAEKILLVHKQENQLLKETNNTNEAVIEKLTDENTKLSNQLPNLRDEVKSLTEKDKTSETDLSGKNLEIQQLQETNKSKEDKIEKLTDENTKLCQQLPGLHDQVKSLTEKDKTSQMALSEKTLEIQQLQETNKTKEDEIEKLTAENTKLSNHLPDLHDQVKSLTEKDKTSQMALSEKTLEIQLLQKTNEDMAAKIEELLQRLVEGECQGGASKKEKRDSGTEKRQLEPEDASEASVKEGMQDTADLPGDVSVADTENSITVTWAVAAGNIDHYTLSLSEVDADRSFTQKEVPGDHHGDASLQQFTFTELRPGTQYNITVRTVSLMSEEVCVLHRTSPAQPDEISIINTTENSISITWAEAKGIRDGYIINISPAEGDNPTAIVDARDPLEHTFRGLTPEREYIVSVITRSAERQSAAAIMHQRTKGVPLVEQETDVLKEGQTPKMEIKVDDLGSEEQKIFRNFAERMTDDQSAEEMLQTLQEEVGQHIGEEAWMEQAYVRIGIIGVSGAGKSTFINSFRGLRAGDSGAAKVGTTETISQTAEYPHPIQNHVILVDFPGALFKLEKGWGRPVSFDMKEYMRKFGQKMKECDVFLVFTSDRVHDNAVWIARKVEDTGKKVLFVRSKFDRDVEDKKRDDPVYFERGQAEGEERLLQTHREDCVTKLKSLGYGRTDGRTDVADVFIISGLLDHTQQSCWDAPVLNEAILKQLDIQQKMLFVMTCQDYSATMVKAKAKIYKSRAWRVAIGAAAGGVIIGTLVTAGTLFKKGFGLNKDSLHKLAALTGKSAEELEKFVDERLGLVKKITQFFQGKIDKNTLQEALVAAGAGGALVTAIAVDAAVDMAVPFIGGLVTAPVSFGLVWKALHLIIEQQEQCALALHEYAFH